MDQNLNFQSLEKTAIRNRTCVHKTQSNTKNTKNTTTFDYDAYMNDLLDENDHQLIHDINTQCDKTIPQHILDRI